MGGAQEAGDGLGVQPGVVGPQLMIIQVSTGHELYSLDVTLRIEHGWAHMGLDAIFILAIFALVTSLIAQYDTAFWSCHGGCVRVPTVRVGAFQTEFTQCR